MGALLDQWKAAKQLFKTTAKAKKPSPTVGMFASKTLGIEKALIKLETLQAKGLAANPKALIAWKSAASDFRIVKTNYLVVLDGAIGKEPAGADRDVYRKGIAVLKTQLNAIDGKIKAFTVGAESEAAGHGMQARMAYTMMEEVEKGCNNALAFVALVRLNPTPQAFNAGIATAARDITQFIGNIDKLRAANFVFAKAQPTNLFNVLKAWGNDGRVVSDNAIPEKVLSELKLFEKAVLGVKAWAA